MEFKNNGFTLVEVLVAMVIFSLSLYFVDVLIGAMRLNSSNMSTLEANQAIQDVFERTARKFKTPATYGQLSSADQPRGVGGYGWMASICQASTTSDSCINTTTLTPTGYSYAVAPGVNILRMTVTYAPNSSIRGKTVTSALEFAKP